MTPAISIIIPIHDQAPRLRLVLAALEAQRDLGDRVFEVIVVDDRSSDELASVVSDQQARGRYPLAVHRCDSGGARGVPRNLGIAHARGDIVLFLDADALPGTELLAGHLAAHDGRGRLVVGDMYVIGDTEHLRDPSDGTPFGRFAPPDAFTLPIDDVRAGLDDDALLARASKGVYPGQARWHGQLEDAIAHGETVLASAGTIPHNLSLDRAALAKLGGFDAALRHLEGWELGVRAVREQLAITLARGARSFHLFHARSGADMSANIEDARRILRRRFPELAVDVLALWIPACFGDPLIPAELGLGDWRGLARVLADPAARAECERLYRLRAALLEPVNALDLRLRTALGSSLALDV